MALLLPAVASPNLSLQVLQALELEQVLPPIFPLGRKSGLENLAIRKPLKDHSSQTVGMVQLTSPSEVEQLGVALQLGAGAAVEAWMLLQLGRVVEL